MPGTKCNLCDRTYREHMSTHLPWSLLATNSVLFIAYFVQQDAVRRSEVFGRPTAPVLLQLSALLGGCAQIGTLIHFFVMTPWYWVFALLALSAVLGGLALGIARFALLGVVTGSLSSRLAVGNLAILAWSYIAWPLFAIWSNAIIANLPG